MHFLGSQNTPLWPAFTSKAGLTQYVHLVLKMTSQKGELFDVVKQASVFIHIRKLPNYVEPTLESHFHTFDHKNTILSRRMFVPRETNVLPDDKGKMYLIYTNIAPLS